VSDPAALALIPVAGVIAAALIAGLFLLAGKRADAQVAAADATDEARRALVDAQQQRIAMLTTERDECREQVRALEAIVRESEHRPTRGKT
jgi:tRNA pseudouridine-54 N-methylase